MLLAAVEYAELPRRTGLGSAAGSTLRIGRWAAHSRPDHLDPPETQRAELFQGPPMRDPENSALLLSPRGDPIRAAPTGTSHPPARLRRSRSSAARESRPRRDPEPSLRYGFAPLMGVSLFESRADPRALSLEPRQSCLLVGPIEPGT
jgi:hypothetical protein